MQTRRPPRLRLRGAGHGTGAGGGTRAGMRSGV
jgi:hypothetical protein